jgi:hypothetical protein
MPTITTNWYVSTNGSTWVTCASLGIERPILTLRANGLDELTFRVTTDFIGTAAFAYGATLHLAYGVFTDGTPAYTTRFIGRINTIPRQATASSESISYTAQGGWWWLDQIIYLQQWQTLRTSDNELINANLPRVVLGQDNAGASRTMGAEVAAAIDWAIARGAPIAKGTIDALATCPYSEHTNLTVADVIRQAIRLQPDTVCYFDYSTGTPTFHCRAASALTQVNVAVLDTAMDTIALTPRYDLQLPGITINYEITSTYNGQTFKSITTDTAGTTSDARAANIIYPMDGVQVETAQQAITVEAYPVDTTDKTFWRTHLPWLADVDDADLTIANVTRSGESDYGNWLTSGQIVSWMGVGSEEETWTAEVSYISKTSGAIDESVASRKVSVKLLSCGGTSKTYRTTLSYTAAETPPSGLAAALYASWGRLHWDGTFRLVETEATFQCGPWNRVNLTGGLAAWTTMDALVPEITVDLDAGTTTVSTGTFGRLQADTLVAFWRGINGRRFATSRLARTDAGAAGHVYIGASGTPVSSPTEGDPGRPRRIVLRDTSTETLLQTIDIDPAAVVHAASGDRTARTLQPREMWIPYQSGGNMLASLCQVLCSENYGTPVALFGASDPGANIVTLGSAALGSEAAATGTDWVAGGANGLRLWIETRQRYYSAGTRQWYAYARAIVISSNGAIYSVSGNETRFTIEIPE